MQAKKDYTIKTERDSNIEAYRIIVMLAIVAHHYVVNSGLMALINESQVMNGNVIFLLLYGCWGKIGINCFVLITGYFMCKSQISLKKFLKLYLEIVFYKVVIYGIFILRGYQAFHLNVAVKNLLPFFSLTDGFFSCYLVFFLFIPFLNIMIHSMNEKQHRWLLILTVGVFSLWASFPRVVVSSNYVFWFMVLYLVGSYIQLYPKTLYEKTHIWGSMSLLSIIFAYASVLGLAWMKSKGITHQHYYFFLADSYKFTALIISICFFIFFKNLKLKYNPLINAVASSTFGVLCIHANSDAMRQWLWRDLCNNVGFFDSPFLIAHAVCVVLAVFAVCTVIDQLRIRFIEKPFFRYFDKQIASKK